jgi:sorting nexin-25
MSRKVRDNIRDWFNETQLMRFINIFRDNMWPDGKPKAPGIPRTTEEKIRTRDEANRKLSSLVPGAYLLELGPRNSRLDT